MSLRSALRFVFAHISPLFYFLGVLGVVIGTELAIAPAFVSGWDTMNAATAACRGEVGRLAKALGRYRADCGRYPDASVGLQGLARDYYVSGWRGPYVDKVPRDPWGRPFLYFQAASSAAPDVLSYGLQGKPGGYGDNADISSRHLNEPLPIAPFGVHSVQFLVAIQAAACLISGACMLVLGRISSRMLMPSAN